MLIMMRINKIQIGRCRYFIFMSFGFLLTLKYLDETLLLDTITLIFKNVLSITSGYCECKINTKCLHFNNHF